MLTRDLSKMTVVQLRDQLRSRGLPTDGTKAVLLERLRGSYAAEDTILNADVSISKDNLEETVLEGAINEDDILGPDTSVKKKENLAPASSPVKTMSVGKGNKTDNVSEISKKKSEATTVETLDSILKRAQRFGLPLSSEQMKQKRAERFGTKPATLTETVENLEEKKKKRAERFGIVNETEKMQDILDKRAKRFGIDKRAEKSSSGTTKASLEVLEKRAKRFGSCSEEAELEIKKQKRAERFGLNKNE